MLGLGLDSGIVLLGLGLRSGMGLVVRDIIMV